MAKRKTKVEKPAEITPPKVTISGGDEGGEFANAIADIFQNAGAEVEVIPPERVHKAGGQAEIISDERWHILYTPQWRTQMDLGEFVGTIYAASQWAMNEISAIVPREMVVIARHFEMIEYRPDKTWHLVGSDGVLETGLPFVTITQVTGE